MKNISTLVSDIYEVVQGNGGWDGAVSEFFSEGIIELAERRFMGKEEERSGLSLSQMGNPDRKLWYKINLPSSGEPLGAETLGTFFYGDLLEILILALAKAAGHDVRGLQTRVEVEGIPGSLDAIIDGWLVDVKSASSYGFQKFASNGLREDDPFGYISQLSSYLYSQQDNPEVVQKHKAAFLVVKKDRFKLCLDVYDFTEELKNKPAELAHKKQMVSGPIPERCYSPEPDGKSGNLKLGVGCSYCDYRKICWPEARTFAYSTGYRHLTKVVNLPKVPEVT